MPLKFPLIVSKEFRSFYCKFHILYSYENNIDIKHLFFCNKILIRSLSEQIRTYIIKFFAEDKAILEPSEKRDSNANSGDFESKDESALSLDCESPGCKLHSARPFPGLMYLDKILSTVR